MNSSEDSTEEVHEHSEMPEQQIQSINSSQFRNEVRTMIDLAIQSNIDPDDVQNILDDLSNGVPYFYEDAQRYNQQE